MRSTSATCGDGSAVEQTGRGGAGLCSALSLEGGASRVCGGCRSEDGEQRGRGRNYRAVGVSWRAHPGWKAGGICGRGSQPSWRVRCAAEGKELLGGPGASEAVEWAERGGSGTRG